MLRRLIIEAYFGAARMPVFPYISELLRLESVTPGEYGGFVEKKLAATLAYAAVKVPYYSDRLGSKSESAAESGAGGGGAAQLKNFPVLDKSDVWENFDKLVAEGADAKRGVTIYTSGSTGRRLKVMYDTQERTSRLALQWYGECMPGAPGMEKLPIFGGAAYIWGASDIRKGGTAYFRNRVRDFLIKQAVLPCYTLTPEKVTRYHALISRMKPRIIVGYVSQLRMFAEIALEFGLEKLTADKVVPAAEQLDSVSERAISEFFDAPIRQRCGSREAGPIAQQCEHGKWHIYSMRVYPEVLRDDGTVSDEGEGRLLLTTLDNRIMPLIRYDIEDRVTLAGPDAPPCECGRPFPMMTALHGRELDCIRLPDGTALSGLAVAEAFRWLPVTEFVFVQESALKATCYFAARHDFTDEMLDVARGKLEARLGSGFELTMTRVDSIPKELYDPKGTGKRRQVVNLTAPARG